MANCMNHSSQARALGLGDFEEDPRTRGILPNTSCRSFRQRLRATRKMNVVQGLAIATGGIVLLAVLILIGMDVAAGDPNPCIAHRVKGLWDSALTFLRVPALLQRVAVEGGRAGVSLDAATAEEDCQKTIDTERLFDLVGKLVLNQQQAMVRLRNTLDRPRQFQSAVLIGPPGVGKTLTASALRHYFPWQGNVHALSGTPCTPGKERDCPVLKKFLAELSDCGLNLLVIDDIAPCDYGMVATYNQLIRDCLEQQSVLVVYIIGLDLDHYWSQFDALQRKLPADTTIVNFRIFGREDLRDCLEMELKLEKRMLDNDEQTRILNEAQNKACCAGCKGLHEIVLKQGRPESV